MKENNNKNRKSKTEKQKVKAIEKIMDSNELKVKNTKK